MFDLRSETWLRGLPGSLVGSSNPPLRLFCLPYAGSGASLYRRWLDSFPPQIAVCPIQLPGRESRLSEPGYTSLKALVDDLAKVLGRFIDQPYALYGHSFGALVCFELARTLCQRYGRGPAHLFAAAYPAPHLPRRHPPVAHQSDQEFLDFLLRFQGIPQTVMDNPNLLEIFLPIMRADFQAYESYQYAPAGPFGFPITVFGGLQDDTIERDWLIEWQRYTLGEFRLELLPGGHLFINTAWPALIHHITQDLRPVIQDKEQAINTCQMPRH